jgi:betaine-homocysteine S-methyltransferase
MSNNILDRLKDGIVIGDGGFVFALEKRGYVKAGPWTPEAVVENPEAVRQLHREFLRAGADVMQTFTFYASEDKLANRGNEAVKIGVNTINEAACNLAREVANEREGNPALVAGGLSQTPTYLKTRDEAQVKAEFRKQCEVFKGRVDFMIVEYFEHVEECVWAIQTCKEILNMPVAATLCIGPDGDLNDINVGDCAVRMTLAGADIVGVNCHFDPFA